MSSDSSPPLRATCLCRGITIHVEDAFVMAGYCHCSECQKFAGAACSAWGRIERERVEFVEGDDLIQHYDKTATGRVAFCRRCGSSLYNEQKGGPFINIRLGLLDDTPTMRPSMHVFCDSRAAWHEIDGVLPRYDTVPG